MCNWFIMVPYIWVFRAMCAQNSEPWLPQYHMEQQRIMDFMLVHFPTHPKIIGYVKKVDMGVGVYVPEGGVKKISHGLSWHFKTLDKQRRPPGPLGPQPFTGDSYGYRKDT